MENKEIKYEIIKEGVVLSTNERGYTKELNLISWNDGLPKYDIREWFPDHMRCSKGITLNKEEAANLCEGLEAFLTEDCDSCKITT